MSSKHLESLELGAVEWLETVRSYRKRFGLVAGTVSQMRVAARRAGSEMVEGDAWGGEGVLARGTSGNDGLTMHHAVHDGGAVSQELDPPWYCRRFEAAVIKSIRLTAPDVPGWWPERLAPVREEPQSGCF